MSPPSVTTVFTVSYSTTMGKLRSAVYKLKSKYHEKAAKHGRRSKAAMHAEKAVKLRAKSKAEKHPATAIASRAVENAHDRHKLKKAQRRGGATRY